MMNTQGTHFAPFSGPFFPAMNKSLCCCVVFTENIVDFECAHHPQIHRLHTINAFNQFNGQLNDSKKSFYQFNWFQMKTERHVVFSLTGLTFLTFLTAAFYYPWKQNNGKTTQRERINVLLWLFYLWYQNIRWIQLPIGQFTKQWKFEGARAHQYCPVRSHI